jgi:fructokinase
VRRHARGPASVVNLFDPHVIVLRGGLSKLGHLYTTLPEMMVPYIAAENRGYSAAAKA